METKTKYYTSEEISKKYAALSLKKRMKYCMKQQIICKASMVEADFYVQQWLWDMIITKEIVKVTSKGSKIYLPITVKL